MTEHVLYQELTPKEFRERLAVAPIAYLPLGTLEWHGEHLPLGSDGLQSQGFMIRLAKEAGGIVLPMLFLGPDLVENSEQGEVYGMDVLGHPKGDPKRLDGSAYFITYEFYGQMVEAILKQLARAGFRIVVGHGHGPSTHHFRKMIPEWKAKYGLELFVCWRDDEGDGLGIQTDHAAANETSLMLALHPDLVHMEYLPQDPKVWPLAVGGDDPRLHASRERGEKSLTLQVERMARILKDALGARI